VQPFRKHLFVLYCSAPVSHSVNMLRSLTVDGEGLSYGLSAIQLSVWWCSGSTALLWLLGKVGARAS